MDGERNEKETSGRDTIILIAYQFKKKNKDDNNYKSAQMKR